MTKTSDGIKRAGFTLALSPVPAPRPRVRVHNGVGFAYYAGKYKTYLAEAPKAIPESPVFFPKGTPVHVDIGFMLPRPKNPANPYPVGDMDNYMKSILDAITKNGTYWHDDSQVVSIAAAKMYTDLEPRHEVMITDAS